MRIAAGEFADEPRRQRRLALATCLILIGCQRSGPPPRTAEPTPATEPPRDLVVRVLDRYRATPVYRDEGIVRLQYGTPSGPVVEETRLAIQLVRPGQLRLELQRDDNFLRLIADGSRLWSQVLDPLTANLRQQVVLRPQPPELGVNELYAATEMVDPANPHEMISLLLSLPFHLQISPLGALLGGSGLSDRVRASGEIAELDPAPIGQVACRKIHVSTSEGPFVFWIDPAGGTLRRLDYPTQSLFQQLPPEQRPTEVALSYELRTVSMTDTIDPVAFRVELPGNAKRVQYFVLPPRKVPSQRFSQTIAPLNFVRLDGSRESSDDWGNQLAVLIWFDDQPQAWDTLTQIDQLFNETQTRWGRVLFRGVCAVPTERLSAEALQQRGSEGRLRLPLVRDLSAVGRDALDVSEAPTVVVLDGQRRLQLFEVGANPQIKELVEFVVPRLLSGENVAADVLKLAQQDEARFARQLELAALVPGTESPHDMPAPAPAAPFTKLKSTLAWELSELESPGHLQILSATENQPARLLVLNAMREAVEVSAEGAVLQRHALPIEESAFVAQLRHAINARGQDRYVGFSPLGRQANVFGESFRPMFRYPPPAQKHQGILDACLIDLDEDQELELYLAFAAPHGCQRVDLQGQRQWSNRVLPSVLSLTPHRLARPPVVLATGEEGWILPIGDDGQAGQAIQIGQRPIHQLTACSSQTERPSQFLGLSYTVEGRLIAVGLDRSLDEIWTYGLPLGTYRHAIDRPSWIPLFAQDTGCWLFAGPDGSVHLVQDDGRFHDFMCTGQDIQGVAGQQLPGVGRLYVAIEGKILAYDLEMP